MDVVTYALLKKYTNKVGSTIQGTSYDYDTGKLTFNTADGDQVVPVNNGMNATYKRTLDNVKYDATDNKLKINGAIAITQDDIAKENIDFSNMFQKGVF